MKNYTMEGLLTLKDNDATLLQSSYFYKVDNEKEASESTTVTQYQNGKTDSHYSYSDKQNSIWKNGVEDKYYVTEFSKASDMGNRNGFKSPFNEKRAPEMEKIFDAMMGNLKDYVQVEQRPEGGKVYSGNLTEVQVPALVNAVSSFGMKQMVLDRGYREEDMKFPEIESDIFVKKVSGRAIENKEGILENLTGDVTLSGKDKSSAQHDLTLNVVLKLSDTGKTTVSKPDLTGKKIEKVSRAGGLDSKYLGKYKNDIIIEKNGKFVKIGERILEITQADDQKVAGKYYETSVPGFEAEYPNKYNFSFEYDPSNEMSAFTYTNPAGEKENGQIHPGGQGKLYLNLQLEIKGDNSMISKGSKNFDGQFSRVFE